jgi:hypothetical protein
MRLLEELGLRFKRQRTEPYSIGEKDFEEWLRILGSSGVYDDHVRRKAVSQEERYRKLSKEDQKKRQEGVKVSDGGGAVQPKSLGGDECQSDSVSQAAGGSKSKERLKGFVRAAAYPNTTKGKIAANDRKAELSRDYEGELNAQVHLVYCQDVRKRMWTVWVKPTGNRESFEEYKVLEDGKFVTKRKKIIVAKIAPRTKKQGGFAEESSRAWGTFRGEAKKKMSCPTCHAPINYPCQKTPDIYGKGATVKSAEKIDVGTLRANRTNPHRARVEKLLQSKNESLDEGRVVVSTKKTKKGEKKVAKTIYKKQKRIPPKDFQKVQYLLGKLNEKQMRQFENEEDENDNFTREDELPFLLKIINKKQKATYDKWVEKGVVKN